MFLGLLLLAACGGGGGGGGTTGGGVGPGGGAAVLSSIAITPANATQTVGTTQQYHATGSYSDGTTRDISGSVGWTSSAPGVAAVAPDGMVSALASGTATITGSLGGVAGNTTVTVASPAAVTFIHDFQSASDAQQPNGPLLQANDGNFYGTSLAGGTHQCQVGGVTGNYCGTVFKIAPNGGESILYSFGSAATEGFTPNAPLIQGKDGALYGTTGNGGAHGAGTVFRLTLAGVYTTLYSFGASPTDGIVPTSLIQASDGNFYGTTASGGANHCVNIPQAGSNCGTVFRLSPAGIETVLYSFGASPSDGVEPSRGLVEGIDGNFYGTTADGGDNTCSSTGLTHSCGTVFKITPAGVETVLHSFGSSTADGIAPTGGLIQGSDGAFYGTTSSGGGGTCGFLFGCGTVYRITQAGSLTVLYAFANTATPRTDGYGPTPFLIQGTDGNFYGTTNSGGAHGGDLEGTFFKLTPSGVHTVLYSFGPLSTDASHPSSVIQASDGAFYGVTDETKATAFKIVVH